MSAKELTAERLRTLIRYDPLGGSFTRLVATGNGRHKAGSDIARPRKSDGYMRVCIDGVKREAGRIAWLYMTGNWPDGVVDHKDGNPQNNKWENLRDIKHRANIENRTRPNKNNKTGFIGVSAHPKKPGMFRAQITVAGRNKALGAYESAAVAHAAYLAAKRSMHEGNTL